MIKNYSVRAYRSFRVARLLEPSDTDLRFMPIKLVSYLTVAGSLQLLPLKLLLTGLKKCVEFNSKSIMGISELDVLFIA